MLAAGMGICLQGKQHQRGSVQMLSPGPSKHSTVCYWGMYQSNLASTSRDSRWKRQGDPVKRRQGFLREIEDPRDYLGGSDGTVPNMVSPEIFLEERVSELRPSGQAEIAWVFKAWETGQVWGI